MKNDFREGLANSLPHFSALQFESKPTSIKGLIEVEKRKILQRFPLIEAEKCFGTPNDCN